MYQYYFSSMNESSTIEFKARLKTIFQKWLHEAAINFGLGNLYKLELQLLVFEEVLDDGIPTQFRERGFESSRYLIFSLIYTMNGKMIRMSSFV